MFSEMCAKSVFVHPNSSSTESRLPVSSAQGDHFRRFEAGLPEWLHRFIVGVLFHVEISQPVVSLRANHQPDDVCQPYEIWPSMFATASPATCRALGSGCLWPEAASTLLRDVVLPFCKASLLVSSFRDVEPGSPPWWLITVCACADVQMQTASHAGLPYEHTQTLLCSLNSNPHRTITVHKQSSTQEQIHKMELYNAGD